MMMSNIERFANEAIFTLQFNTTSDAVRYVMRNAQVDRQTAVKAVQSTVAFHKAK